VRLVAGSTIVAALVWQLGGSAFLDGLRSVTAWSLVGALLLSAGTTVCCAWRWTALVRGMGVQLSMPDAVAAYYRSQFLNSALPGGVVGDVHRAVRHGRDAGDLPRGARAVVWDRATGQVVQVVLAVGVLLALPSPARSAVPAVAVAGALVVLTVCAVLGLFRGRSSRLRRWVGIVRADLRDGVLARGVWPTVVAASTLAVVGHVLMFLLAARTAGATGSVTELVPLALLVLVAMGVPLNVAGWGPREGVAAWAFGAAGLGGAQGIGTAVVYGVMVLVSALPGAVVLVIGARRPAHA
jgi:uncharacterized membrane protein YbhN (UPF0104 family)